MGFFRELFSKLSGKASTMQPGSPTAIKDEEEAAKAACVHDWHCATNDTSGDVYWFCHRCKHSWYREAKPPRRGL